MVYLNDLKEEQERLSKNVVLKDGFKKIKFIAGIDQTYEKNEVISCIVVCNAKTMEVVEKQVAIVPAGLAYKPGLLAYREMPAMVEAFSKLEIVPDLIIIDGHGIAHPKRLGLASHFGIVISRPTIGVSKSLTCGKIENGKIYVDKEMRGFELKTREHANPVYVSPGNLVSLGTALKVVTDTIKPPHKLPEPLHLAHRGARKALKRFLEEKKI